MTAREIVVRMREEGASLKQIADRLTEDEKYKTPRGKDKWYPSQVRGILRSVELDRVVAARQRVLDYGEAALHVPEAVGQLAKSLGRLEQLPDLLRKEADTANGVLRRIQSEVDTDRNRLPASVSEFEDHARLSVGDLQAAEQLVLETRRAVEDSEAFSRRVEADLWLSAGGLPAAEQLVDETRSASESAQVALGECAYEAQVAVERAREALNDFQSSELYLDRAVKELAKLSFSPTHKTSDLPPTDAVSQAKEITQVMSMTAAAAERTQIAAITAGATEEISRQATLRVEMARTSAETARGNAELAVTAAEMARDKSELMTTIVEISSRNTEIAEGNLVLAKDRALVSSDRARVASALATNIAAMSQLLQEVFMVTNRLSNTIVKELNEAHSEARKSYNRLKILSEFIQTDS